MGGFPSLLSTNAGFLIKKKKGYRKNEANEATILEVQGKINAANAALAKLAN